MNCDECKAKNKNVPPVEYVVYEGAMARSERVIKRLIIALVIAVILIVACNGAWLLYVAQYDFTNYSYSQDGQGINLIGDSNTVDYGAEITNQEAYTEEP